MYLRPSKWKAKTEVNHSETCKSHLSSLGGFFLFKKFFRLACHDDSMTSSNKYSLLKHWLIWSTCLWIATNAYAADTSPATLQIQYEKLSGQPADAARGQKFFNIKHANEWSCASCHGNPPTQASKHASTGKNIAALAPKFNPDRLTDNGKVEKWFRRNCKDVLNRECTVNEKADVVAYLRSL